MIHDHFLTYLIVTAGVTYLVRMLPLVLMKGRIRNRFSEKRSKNSKNIPAPYLNCSPSSGQ